MAHEAIFVEYYSRLFRLLHHVPFRHAFAGCAFISADLQMIQLHLTRRDGYPRVMLGMYMVVSENRGNPM